MCIYIYIYIYTYSHPSLSNNVYIYIYIYISTVVALRLFHYSRGTSCLTLLVYHMFSSKVAKMQQTQLAVVD